MEYLFTDTQKRVYASVHEICDFIFRTGDVYTGGTDITGEAMLIGAKFHRQLQAERKRENKSYQSEFDIKYTEEFDGFEYTVHGRIDGIVENGDGTIIDEFKTTSKDLDELEWDTIKAHCAQLFCYGYMYAQLNSLNYITLRLTYFNYDSEQSKTLEKELTYTQLRQWFVALIDEHIKWPKLIYYHRISRNKSLKNMNFPYGSFRDGQRQLSALVYRSIRDEKKLFAEAPTGIGKTVSTIFPSLKALGEEIGEKVFYLSAKNIGSLAATDCLDMCINKGADVWYTSMTSKDKICFRDKNCLPTECEYSKGHYDRVNAALYELISRNERITKDKIIEIAEKHKVCPFELQLDASEFCDVVVGDYNYFFDPRAKLCRYFGDMNSGKYIILVDEAHNLVDRAREMYSASLSYYQLKKYSKHLKGLRKLSGRLNKCIAYIDLIRHGLELSGKSEKKLVISEKDMMPFRSFCDAYRKFLSDDTTHDEAKRETLQLFFDISFFVEIFDIESCYQSDYIDYCGIEEKDCYVRLFCANPSQIISYLTKQLLSCTFFSATLTPREYYIKMLGFDESTDNIVSLPSPFPPENFFTAVFKNISTRYKDRDKSIETICNIIKLATEKKLGNYLCFFPSYAYMESVYGEFCVMYPEVKTELQSKDMTQEEREAFLKKFTDNPGETLVGFALSGGMFSEGVDLKGDRLSGAIIIGTGLPGICFERDMLKELFDVTIGEGMGYNYAYTYTGLNRVYQAAGRVIRTKTDKGFVILVDDRYSKMSHRKTFPDSWKNVRFFSETEALSNSIEKFWKNDNNLGL